MTSFEFRAEGEPIVLFVAPHPTEVEKGDFVYWNDLCLSLGIDLEAETEINAQMEADNESSVDDGPQP